MVDALTLLQELVAVPSPSQQECAAVAYLVQQMSSLGYKAFKDEAGNAVGIIEQPDDQGNIIQEIVLLGHIDTVPGDIPVRVENGLLFGRGTVDAKGSLATFVFAGAQASLPSGTRLIVVGAVEEEAATSKGAWHIVEHYQPDLCIIGEPSNWDAVTLGYKGRVLFEYRLTQSMNHSAGPEQAVAEHAVNWWDGISAFAEEFNQDRASVFEQLSPSLREIVTDSNGLHNSVFAKVGVRLPPGFDLGAFEATVRALAGEAEFKAYGAVPAYQAKRQNQLVRAFSMALREQGVRPRLKVKTGTSDMNVVAPLWDCPVVAYGPGDSRLDHTPNEHLSIEEYHRAIAVLTRVLEISAGQVSAKRVVLQHGGTTS